MRVLVTGAEGALGSRIVRRMLASGHDVVAPVSLTAALVMERIGAIPAPSGDEDPSALAAALVEHRPEAVVHALPSMPPRDGDGLWASQTRALVDAATEAGGLRFVSTSFVHAYGHLGWRVATESRPLSPRAPSAALQDAFNEIRDLEHIVLDATSAGRIGGIVLRLGAMYGPDVGSTRFLLRLLRRRVVPLPGGGRAVMSWVHVQDAADAVVAAVAHARPGEVYNVVDDEPVSLRDYLSALADATGARRPIPVPAFFGRFGGALAALSGSIELRVSNEKARAELRWSPSFPTYRQGLRDLASSAGA